jgi:serine/threonine protein kinase
VNSELRDPQASPDSDGDHTVIAEPTGLAQAARPEPLSAPGLGTELRARFRYRLIKRLGRGSFGSVFFARCLDHDPRRDDSPPDRVAIKVLGASRQNATEMLRRELAAMLATRDRRIPRVYDWSLEEDAAYVVMQYFPAGSLRDLMPMEGQVSEETVWKMLGDVLGALEVAHRASVLHLDIKPANVLLDGEGGFVLTDFGVSQASRLARGLLPFSVGTRGYQAPEQRGERFDEYDLRTDLYSLGATAWAVATGIHLANRPELVNLEANDTFGLPPLSEHRPECSPELETLVMSLLRINPAERPGSVGSVLARVHAALGDGTSPELLEATWHSNLDDDEVEALIDSLVDPLLISICQNPAFRSFFVRFEDGETLCAEGEGTSYAFLVLRGTIVVSRDDREITRASGEGRIVGDVGTLAGRPRTATLSAAGETWAIVLNEAELERFLTVNPAMALRVIRSMAHRLAAAPPTDKPRS